MAISLAEVCNAIEVTLGAAVGMVTSDSYDELTEGIPPGDCPKLQVYPDSGTCDPSGNTERTAFGGGVRQNLIIIHADLYARKRSKLDEDMKAVTEMIDAIITVLEEQNTLPFFGEEGDGIKAFTWRWKRSPFNYGGQKYMGARFYLTCRIF